MRLTMYPEAKHHGKMELTARAVQDCGVAYTINLRNGQRLDMEVYLAFDQPEAIEEGVKDPPAPKTERGLAARNVPGFRWPAVRRARCIKGCSVSIQEHCQRLP